MLKENESENQNREWKENLMFPIKYLLLNAPNKIL